MSHRWRASACPWKIGGLIGVLCAALLLTLAVGRSAARPASAVRWEFVVSLPNLERGLAEVTWTLYGLSGTLRLCGDMDGAGRYVTELWQLLPGGPPRRIPRDGECFRVAGASADGVTLRYGYDLRALSRATGQPDYCARYGGTYIFNDETLLLRPDPLPRPATIDVTFQVPEGIVVATPWARLPGAGWRFRYDAEQYDYGSYVALGRLEDLGEIKLHHSTVQLNVIAAPRRASKAVLRRWISEAMGAVDDFYQGLISDRVHIVLVPVQGSDGSGVFGTVMRHGQPSAVVYFGAESSELGLNNDWVAVHELFHIGNPKVMGKMSWFVEGFTTYYQDVLRARGKGMSAVDTWGDLHDGVRRFCQPDDGLSLAEESERLRYSYRYTRVYWGGACLALLADVAIREHSAGKQSLDDVLRALYKKSRSGPLSESEVVQALDSAAGRQVVGAYLYEKRRIPVEKWYQRLGIEPTGKDTVRLRDDAPLAALRRAIF